MVIKVNIETVNDANTIIDVLQAAKLKHEVFASEIKIEDKPEDIKLWQNSIDSAKLLGEIIHTIQKEIK